MPARVCCSWGPGVSPSGVFTGRRVRQAFPCGWRRGLGAPDLPVKNGAPIRIFSRSFGRFCSHSAGISGRALARFRIIVCLEAIEGSHFGHGSAGGAAPQRCVAHRRMESRTGARSPMGGVRFLGNLSPPASLRLPVSIRSRPVRDCDLAERYPFRAPPAIEPRCRLTKPPALRARPARS